MRVSRRLLGSKCVYGNTQTQSEQTLGMVLGGATQKIQTIVELAEELYDRVTEVREQVLATKETVEDSHDRIQSIEEELSEQRVVLEKLAEHHEIDVETVISRGVDEGESETDVASDDP